MTEVAEKKGMSKGCLVALIVAGVLLVLVVALFFVCNAYKDDLVKSGTVMLINSTKQYVAESPPEGIDTAQFNMIADRFVHQFNIDTLNMERFQVSFRGMQNLMGQKEFDSAQVADITQMMVDYYPELEELLQIPEEIDSGIIDGDSAKTQ